VKRKLDQIKYQAFLKELGDGVEQAADNANEVGKGFHGIEIEAGMTGIACAADAGDRMACAEVEDVTRWEDVNPRIVRIWEDVCGGGTSWGDVNETIVRVWESPVGGGAVWGDVSDTIVRIWDAPVRAADVEAGEEIRCSWYSKDVW
jgi:hypothetical protein